MLHNDALCFVLVINKHQNRLKNGDMKKIDDFLEYTVTIDIQWRN